MESCHCMVSGCHFDAACAAVTGRQVGLHRHPHNWSHCYPNYLYIYIHIYIYISYVNIHTQPYQYSYIYIYSPDMCTYVHIYMFTYAHVCRSCIHNISTPLLGTVFCISALEASGWGHGHSSMKWFEHAATVAVLDIIR